MSSTLQRIFPALAEPTLRRYLTGQVVSVLGSWTQNVTLNLVVYHLSGSAAVLVLLNFLLYGPQLVIAPLAGARITSTNARRATLTVLYSSLVVACSLAVLSALDWLTMPIILGHALAIGILTSIESPARQVLLVSCLKDATHLSNAVAMNTMVYNVGRMVGPTVAAVMYPTLGPPVAFVTYALALCVMAWCVRSMSIQLVMKRASDTKGGLRQAFSYILDDRFTARYLSILVCMGLFAGSYQTLVPLIADQVFHNAAKFTGIFFASAGVGSLTAAVILSSAIGSMTTKRFLWIAPWFACIALAVLASGAHAVLTGLAFFMLGFSLTFSATSTNATIQRRCPDNVRGALVGMYGMAYNGTMPFGYLLVGSVSEAFGVQGAFGSMAFVLAGSLMLLTAVYWAKEKT